MNACLDALSDKESIVQLNNCLGLGGNQYWEYNGTICRDDYCIHYEPPKIVLKHRRRTKGNQVSGAKNFLGVEFLATNICATSRFLDLVLQGRHLTTGGKYVAEVFDSIQRAETFNDRMREWERRPKMETSKYQIKRQNSLERKRRACLGILFLRHPLPIRHVPSIKLLILLSQGDRPSTGATFDRTFHVST